MKNTQYMTVLYANTSRDLVDKVNNRGIQQKDIVSLLKDNDTYILFYYASSEE